MPPYTEVNLLALKIRLARAGAKKAPFYRVVAADARAPRDGRFIEILGRYNPRTQPSTVEIDLPKIEAWVAKGAQPTEAVTKLIAIARGEKTAPVGGTKISKKAAAKAVAAAEAAEKAAAAPAPEPVVEEAAQEVAEETVAEEAAPVEAAEEAPAEEAAPGADEAPAEAE